MAYKVEIEYLIYRNFIKYEDLAILTNKAFEGSEASELDIYIDMYTISMSLFRQHDNINIPDPNILAAGMINLCAHLRNFYSTRYNVITNIFIVNTYNNSKKNLENYNSTNILKRSSSYRVKEFINKNVEILNMLVPYLPNIYFIDGSEEVSVLIYNDIYKRKGLESPVPNMVLTTDVYNYQLCAMIKNLVIFNRKLTTPINHNNVMSTYAYETKSSKIPTDIINKLNPELLSLLMTLTNLPSRNIKSLYNFPTAVILLYNSIVDYKILNQYNSDIDLIYSSINKVKKINMEYETVLKRFKDIDVVSQYINYNNNPISNDGAYLVNLHNPKDVQEINNKYFIINPLDLNRL